MMALGADWNGFREPIEWEMDLVDTNHWPPGGMKGVGDGDEEAPPRARDLPLLSIKNFAPPPESV